MNALKKSNEAQKLDADKSHTYVFLQSDGFLDSPQGDGVEDSVRLLRGPLLLPAASFLLSMTAVTAYITAVTAYLLCVSRCRA